VIALVRPLTLDHDTTALHLPAAAASTLLLCVLLGTRGGISRPAGAVLLALYVAYVGVAVAIGV
jgi:Ca2+/Na+ antiporter